MHFVLFCLLLILQLLVAFFFSLLSFSMHLWQRERDLLVALESHKDSAINIPFGLMPHKCMWTSWNCPSFCLHVLILGGKFKIFRPEFLETPDIITNTVCLHFCQLFVYISVNCLFTFLSAVCLHTCLLFVYIQYSQYSAVCSYFPVSSSLLSAVCWQCKRSAVCLQKTTLVTPTWCSPEDPETLRLWGRNCLLSSQMGPQPQLARLAGGALDRLGNSGTKFWSWRLDNDLLLRSKRTSLSGTCRVWLIIMGKVLGKNQAKSNLTRPRLS